MAQGRIVWVVGNLFTGRGKTDYNTKQPKIDPKTGKQQVEYGFGLAIPKSVLGNMAPGQPGEVWAALHEEAFTLFPSKQIPPAFAMKYKDGDGVDDKGASFTLREGYAGHIVLACTTNIQPKFYRFENGQNFQITEGIKCGDYVDVQLNVKAHPAIGQGKAGIYVNPYAVRFLGYGKEIINTPSGDDVFGVAAPVIPQGASATPLAPAGMISPPGGHAPPPIGQNATSHAYQGAPQPVGQPYPGPAPQMPDPHYGVLPQAHQPAPYQQPQMAPAPNVYQPAPAAAPSMPQMQPGYATSAPVPAGGTPPAPMSNGFPIPGFKA